MIRSKVRNRDPAFNHAIPIYRQVAKRVRCIQWEQWRDLRIQNRLRTAPNPRRVDKLRIETVQRDGLADGICVCRVLSGCVEGTCTSLWIQRELKRAFNWFIVRAASKSAWRSEKEYALIDSTAKSTLATECSDAFIVLKAASATHDF